ncbi:AAA-domain-containing protein [Obba rivulosa]|uniref:AAA-domain-containing protein n=1 Tax=Obba rivulosa TaxID=1052685 RepID=A0A8E2J2D8_9APHY|nr:AAA-domain-containing protein [Obba rivulosa]
MAPNTRGSTRHRADSMASGSEYHESNASIGHEEEEPPADDEPAEDPVEFALTSRGRKVVRKSYKESASEDGLQDEDEDIRQDGAAVVPNGHVTHDDDDDDDDDQGPRYLTRNRMRKRGKLGGFIVSDEEDHANGRYPTRNRTKNAGSTSTQNGTTRSGRLTRRSSSRPQLQAATSRESRQNRLNARRARQNEQTQEDEDVYVHESSSGSGDADEFDEAPHTSPEPEEDADAEGEVDMDADGETGQVAGQDGKPYSLRRRPKVNYAIPPPLEEMPPPPPQNRSRNKSNRSGFTNNRRKAPGWSATGADYDKWFGGGGNDSDSDYGRTPRKPFGGGAVTGGGMFAGGAGGGLYPTDLAAAAGTPSNLGKVGDAVLADADPLGVSQNVTFDEVGGLDDHINSLKEMTLLPLLYPEVFQRFNVTPPRGVLFHGPPGTGKTLLARALAASCRSNGKGISFFMRKGADCLSKWVGEAERQLRLLFEEARNSQPSIIFFDEIDGLAPVRSSKQDQIHASIVSTLLALMDGMDGRGQVIVIGATNRPDAIDPALRRPGRFDREFYFPLPGLEARERILRIMTRQWAGWESEKGEENVKGLAKLTKGYGGADLRALCTEAALNAVQRRYPQIYKSNDRLLLQPESINIELRDFMISIKKLVPSSARSVSSAATPLPTQLVPLLQDSVEKAKEVVGKVLPVSKKRSALEEAVWEDEGGSEGALEREMMMQAMETLRIHRPRVVLHGPVGMGQAYVAAAILHHLEGYHVQSLDLGNLMSDSAKTPEAAIVQLFVEAKRHQPSIIYIPSLVGWCAAMSETSRTTVRAMLDSLSPTDPVLLLAVVDGKFTDLPRDVRAWFGPTRDNRIELTKPGAPKREEFFNGLMQDIRRPPNQFPDGVKRKKRVLEDLPVAPAPAPREPTAAELAMQEENDQRAITLLKYRLGPILTELKRKFKRFTKRAVEEYGDLEPSFPLVPPVGVVTTSIEMRTEPDGDVELVGFEEAVTQPPVNGVNGGTQDVLQLQPPPPPPPRMFDMDLERMHVDLYKGKYLTPDEFLDDIRKIVHNAHVRAMEDSERMYRAQAMLTAAEVSIQDFDPQFRLECQRMAAREHKRREERRKNKEKERAAENNHQNGPFAPGTRRSARHNGQQPEAALADPDALMRTLKRQRSHDAAATPSEDEGGERSQKRSKVSPPDDDDRDPIDLLAQHSTPPRPLAVRFADEVERPQTPVSPSSAQGELPRRSGFDPALLNPLPIPDTAPLPTPVFTNDPESLVINSEPNISQHHQLPSESAPQTPMVVTPVAVTATTPADSPNVLMDILPEQQQPPDAAMEVDRTPTPLPDFHVDETLWSTLKCVLRDNTDTLNVEHLEQLRAVCLASVWRHRSDWDRTGLLQELLEVIKEFVDEVSVDDMDSPSP